MKKLALTSMGFAISFSCAQAHAAPQALAALKADAQAINNATVIAGLLVSAGSRYSYAGYSGQRGAGMGPQVADNPFGGGDYKGGTLLCPNPLWRAVTKPLSVGVLNLAGNAEALGYSVQTLTTHWQEDLIRLMEAQTRAGVSSAVTQSEVNRADTALAALLKATGQQIQDAMQPGTTNLVNLPKGNQGGIGNIPAPASVTLTQSATALTGLGWTKLPEFCPSSNAGCSAVVVAPPKVCPAYTASIGSQSIESAALAMARQAIADDPAMQTALAPAMGASALAVPTQTLHAVNDSNYTFVAPSFSARIALTRALAHDVAATATDIQPILSSLRSFNNLAQQITQQEATR